MADDDSGGKCLVIDAQVNVCNRDVYATKYFIKTLDVLYADTTEGVLAEYAAANADNIALEVGNDGRLELVWMETQALWTSFGSFAKL